MCRVGGNKFSSLNQTVRYEAISYACELLSAFGINISSDKSEVHPNYVGILCQRTFLSARKESAAYCDGGCWEIQEWTQHTWLNCTLCIEQSKLKSKGRPKKSTHTSPQHLRGRAAAVTNNTRQQVKQYRVHVKELMLRD